MTEIPAENRSETPTALRNLAYGAGDATIASARETLLNAAAEIEGSEDAFAALVGENRRLREKLARTESNLRMMVDLVPAKQL